MRVNNLEFREASYLGYPPEHIGWDIILWEPNSYYGKESNFIRDGEYYRPNNEQYSFVKIHKDCFKNPETCFVIASWKWDSREDCYDFEFCGDRPLRYLKDSDWTAFKELIDYGFKQLNPSWYETDDTW